MRRSVAGPALGSGSVAWGYKSTTGAPGARVTEGMCLDASGNILMYGGQLQTSSDYDDTWIYTEPSGTPTWTQQSPTHTPAGLVGTTGGFADCLMRLDPISGNVIEFGGYNLTANRSFNMTLSWSGTDWSQLQADTASPGANQPPRRSEAAVDFDSATGKIMLTGGGSGSGARSDTWVYNGNSTWTQITGTGLTALQGHIMVRDPLRNTVVIFGGYNETSLSVTFNNTWTWNGSVWTQQSPVTVPAPRAYAQAWYDPRLQMVVFYGGFGNISTFQPALFDMWGWNGSQWVKIRQDVLTDLCGASQQLVYSTKFSKAYSFGGYNSFDITSFTRTATSQPYPGGLNAVQGGVAYFEGASGTSVTTTFAPTGNDRTELIAIVALHKPSGSTATIPTPSGWTSQGTGGSGGSPFMGVFTCNSAASVSAVTFAPTISSGNLITSVLIFETRGQTFSTADGLSITGTGSTGTSASVTGSTPSASGELALVAFAVDSGAAGAQTTSTTPSGWSLIPQQPDNLNTVGVGLWAYWKVGTASAPSASLSWTNPAGTGTYTTLITSFK